VAGAVRKLPPSYHRVGLAFATTFFMTFLVSGVATYRALQPGQPLVGTWMVSWMVSWVIACPTMYLVMPRVRRFIGLFVEER
jgi:hypothetical protein